MKKTFNAFMAAIIAIVFTSCNSAPKNEEAAAGPTIPAASGTMFTVLHSVGDFNKFKEVFNAHDSLRKAFGLDVVAVGKGLDDPNMVMVATNVSDMGKAQEFASSPSLQQAMQEATVTGQPEIAFISMVRNDMSKID